MSEEMKQTVETFCKQPEIVAALDKLADSDKAQFRKVVEALAAQVWEQREKEHGHTLKQRDQLIEELGESEVASNLIAYKQRAEAAELALQTRKGDYVEFVLVEECEKLKAALQAKEQDAATWRRVAEKLETEKAQARQQAIAECVDAVYEQFKIANRSGVNGLRGSIILALRSLTPPPAPNKTCVGYEGGCDGNLVGLEHEPNCPLAQKEGK